MGRQQMSDIEGEPKAAKIRNLPDLDFVLFKLGIFFLQSTCPVQTVQNKSVMVPAFLG